MKNHGWTFSEERILKDNYNDKTIKELEMILPGRSREAINNKIKRLKSKGKIKDGKSKNTIQRSYIQRGKEIVSES